MRPLIGIPPALDDRGRWRTDREYQYVDTAYARAVEAGGGTPVYLPLYAHAEVLVERIDGLLLPGGDDFPPPHPYPADVRFDLAPPRQIAFDGNLLGSALERELPLLAICYGMQLLALHCGGELHYDLATDVPKAGPHQLSEHDGRHGLEIQAGSQLSELLGDTPGLVNSHHHQAVAKPGSGLQISARADDGLIEAIERPRGAFCIGVQWHPERMEGAHRERLFSGFVRACRS